MKQNYENDFPMKREKCCMTEVLCYVIKYQVCG